MNNQHFSIKTQKNYSPNKISVVERCLHQDYPEKYQNQYKTIKKYKKIKKYICFEGKITMSSLLVKLNLELRVFSKKLRLLGNSEFEK